LRADAAARFIVDAANDAYEWVPVYDERIEMMDKWAAALALEMEVCNFLYLR
jgi:hypothetical protein